MEGETRKAHLDFVLLGNPLSNSDDEGDLVLDGLDDCVCRSGRGNIDDGSIGLGLLYGLNTYPLSGGT